jgi:hypothetical protein
MDDATPAAIGSDADALRLLADDVVRNDVGLDRLAAFIRDVTEATLIEPPAVARAAAGSLRRLFTDMPAAAVAAFLRHEARRLDEAQAG